MLLVFQWRSCTLHSAPHPVSVTLCPPQEKNGFEYKGKAMYVGRAQKKSERMAELKEKFDKVCNCRPITSAYEFLTRFSICLCNNLLLQW